MFRLIFILSILFALCLPSTASAQSDYGQRLASKDGKWLLPVATRILSSSDDDHLRRGSINSWDLSAAEGTPVFAAAPGVIEAAGCDLYERRQWPIMQGYGCAISIKHGDGIVSQYGHCKNGSIYVQRGDQVTATTPICQVGWTGKTSFGPHTHFTILVNGRPIRISSLFDIGQMNYCKFCPGNNDPRSPVANAGSVANQQPATQPAATTRLDAIKAALRQAGPNVVATAALGLFGLLCLVWWLGGLYERVAVVALATSSLVVGVALWLTLPLATPVQAGQQSAVTGSAAWEWAYPAIQQQEGWSCTNDGAYTMGGVTQGTFNRWRAKMGQPTGDVCKLLTREEAKRIYHDLYWLPAGGDKLPAAVALTVVDHYINTGRYKFLLDQCGPDVACISRVRTVDYRSMRNFNLYGAAYLNRVQRIANYIQKGNQQ